MPEITIALRVADDHRVTVATTMPQPQVGAPLCVTQSLALDAINAIKRNPRCAGVEWGQQDSKDHALMEYLADEALQPPYSVEKCQALAAKIKAYFNGSGGISDAEVSAAADMLQWAAGQASIPKDPMDWRLPCDVTIGQGTMCKGVTLRALVARMKTLYDMATENNAEKLQAVAELKKKIQEQAA